MRKRCLSAPHAETISHRILVAEDDESSRRLLVDLLEEEGYEVVQASERTAALRILREQSIDLGLLDVMMPGETGFSICREAKRAKETRLIPIVLVTGLANSTDRVLG